MSESCDIYMSPELASRTAMAMTVNADAGTSAANTFRSEGLHRFLFDLNGDARVGSAFEVRVGDPTSVRGNPHENVQSVGIRRTGGAEALPVVTQTAQAVIRPVNLRET